MLNQSKSNLRNSAFSHSLEKFLLHISQNKFKKILLSLLFFSAIPATSIAISPDWGRIEELLKSKQTSSAKKLLNAVLTSNPNNQAAELLMAQIYVEENNTIAAVNIYQNIAKQNNAPPLAINNLAVAYARQGKLNQAMHVLQQGIKNDPNFSILSDNINRIYSMQASNAYKKALSKPDEPSIKINETLTLELISIDPQQYLKTSQTQQITPTTSLPAPLRDTTTELEVIRTIHSWAKAWSAQKVNNYLVFYHQDFQLPRNVSRKSWESFRKKRIRSPRRISVTIEDPLLLSSADKNLAVIEFTQKYRSDTFRETSRKLLVLRKTSHGWRIFREYLSN